jgi:hypothetical protein
MLKGTDLVQQEEELRFWSVVKGRERSRTKQPIC